jgi:energy-converting hydrogenase Eha subunit A
LLRLDLDSADAGGAAPGLGRRARIALLVAALGIATSIVPTILFLLVIEDKKGDVLGWEILVNFPLHLLTALIGAVVGVLGALMFKRAVRKEIEEFEKAEERVGELLAHSREARSISSEKAAAETSPQSA